MGSGGRFLLLLVAALLAVAVPTVNSQIDQSKINYCFVATTRVVCTVNGNPCNNFSAPVAGVPATLICNGVKLGTAVSNSNGIITFFINQMARFLRLRCSIVIPLNRNIACSFLQGPGSLFATTTISSVAEIPVGIVDGVPTQNLVGVIDPFTRVVE